MGWFQSRYGCLRSGAGRDCCWRWGMFDHRFSPLIRRLRSDPALRHRRTEKTFFAQDGFRRMDWRVRVDRTTGRLGCVCAQNPCTPRRRSLCDRWLQAVHHIRQERQRGDRVCRYRSIGRQERHFGFHRADRYSGLRGCFRRAQARPAFVGYLCARFHQHAHPSREPTGR